MNKFLLENNDYFPISKISRKVPLKIALKYFKPYESIDFYGAKCYYFKKSDVLWSLKNNEDFKKDIFEFNKKTREKSKLNKQESELIENCNVSYYQKSFDCQGRYITEKRTLENVNVLLKGSFAYITTRSNVIKKSIKLSKVSISKYL